MLPYQAVHPGGVGRTKRVMALVGHVQSCQGGCLDIQGPAVVELDQEGWE